MLDAILSALSYGSVISVPLACFATAVLYTRAGLHKSWTIALNVVAVAAIFGAGSFFGIFGPTGTGPSTAGSITIFASAILVTGAAIALAYRKWPAISAPDGDDP